MNELIDTDEMVQIDIRKVPTNGGWATHMITYTPEAIEYLQEKKDVDQVIEELTRLLKTYPNHRERIPSQ